MKKYLALILAVIMVLAFASCGNNDSNVTTEAPKTNAPADVTTEAPATDIFAKSEGTKTYAEYLAAAKGDVVTIEAFVQAKADTFEQYGNTNLFLADKDGAYYVYRLTIKSADDWAKIKVGTKMKITGVKTDYKGLIELGGNDEVTPGTYEILDGEYVADAVDITDKIGTDKISDYMCKLVTVKGTVVAKDGAAFTYKYNGTGAQGDDAYFWFKVGSNDAIQFLVETDIANKDTAVYKAVEAFKDGDAVTLTGFAYWYDGIQLQVTAVNK